MTREFLVLGLGSFGASVALTLEEMGCNVIVVDKSEEKVEAIADKVSYAMCAEIEDEEVLQTLGARNLDGAIVAVAEQMEASIMATITLKELGVPYVLAKAGSQIHEKILKKVGADAIIFPEREMGMRVAKRLISSKFRDWINFSPEYSMVELQIPREWAGKSLVELKVREKYGINVVGYEKNGQVNIALNPHEALPEECVLIMVGSDAVLKNFREN